MQIADPVVLRLLIAAPLYDDLATGRLDAERRQAAANTRAFDDDAGAMRQLRAHVALGVAQQAAKYPAHVQLRMGFVRA